MSKVMLEVVGIYFRKEVKLPKKGKKLTVQQIMDLAIEEYGNSTTPGGLDYMTKGRSNPMDVIRHNWQGGLTRGNQNRMAGIYELREDRKERPIVRAWQYYVVNSKGERVSATYPGEGFNSFVDAEFKFDDGWKVIWRLVTVLSEPNVSPVLT